MSISSSGLFDDTKLYEGSNDLKRAQSSFVHSFLVGLFIRQTFYHISRILCLIYFFWNVFVPHALRWGCKMFRSVSPPPPRPPSQDHATFMAPTNLQLPGQASEDPSMDLG